MIFGYDDLGSEMKMKMK